ncbi:VCBS domain-containing protein, partial [Grimontia marina]|uniref:VCBS domain-containing protein n=1 Tax=Grimontia marina TaxID=646534 RepID=UPI000A585B28
MAMNLVLSQVVGQAFVVKPDGEMVPAAENTVVQTGDVLSVPNGKNAWLVTKDGEQVDLLDEALLVSEEGFEDLDLPSDVAEIITAIEEGDDPTQKEGTETAAGEAASGSALTAASVIEYNASKGGAAAGLSTIVTFDSTGLLSSRLSQEQADTLISTRYAQFLENPAQDSDGDGEGSQYRPPSFEGINISMQEDGEITLSRDDILSAVSGGDPSSIRVSSIQANTPGATVTENADGSFTLTPPPDFSGTVNFAIEITDGQNSVTGNVTISVSEVEDDPEISVTPVELTEDENVSEGSVIASIDASDADGDELTITISNDPNGYFAVENGKVVLTAAGAAAIDDDTLNLQQISVTVSVSDGKTTVEETVTLPITRKDDDATVQGDTIATVTDNNGTTPASASGTLNIVDPDSNNETTLDDGIYKGEYGTLVVENGSWVYTVEKVLVTPLVDGDKVTDVISITASDGSTHEIILNIEGTNDPALISGDVTATVVGNNGTMTATGSLTSSDVDGTDNKFIAETITTLRGEVSIDENGNWTYTTTDPTGAIQRLSEGETLTEVVTVRSEDGTAQQIVLTIEGVNDRPVFSAITERDVYESNEVVNVSGSINVVDPDEGQSYMDAGTYVGELGSVTMDRNGNWTYSSDPSQNAVLDSLKEGEQRVDTITVRSQDGTETEIKVTIIGTNDPAQITGDIVGTIVEADGTMSTSGQLISTDIDGNNNTFTAQTIEGLWGEITIEANGSWNYSTTDETDAINLLGEGNQLTDTLSVRAEDGTVQTITITIDGTNDTAVFSGKTSATVDETDGQISTSGRAIVSDADYGEHFFQEGTYSGTYGDITIDKVGNWTYISSPENTATFDTLDAGDTIPESITVYSLDGTPLTIDITIQGTDDLPVVGGQTVGSLTDTTSGAVQTVSGSLSIIDVDADDTPTFEDTSIEGEFGVLEMVDGKWTYTLDKADASTLNAGETDTDVITLTANDGTEQKIVITLTGTDDEPLLTGNTVGSISDNGSPTTSGFIDVFDPDSDNSPMLPDAEVNGQYGSLTLVDGKWIYTLTPDSVAALPDGETTIDVVTVEASDGSKHEITITITGTDQEPVLTGNTTGIITEGSAALTVSGSVELVDVDTGENPTLPNGTTAGQYGSLNLVDGEWTYTLDPDLAQYLDEGESTSDTISITASDGTVHDIVITITGSEDSAVLSGDTTGGVTDETGSLTASGSLTVSDPDSSDTPTLPDINQQGQYGSFTMVDGNWTYTLDPELAAEIDEGVTVTDTITITDSMGGKHELAISVTGTDNSAQLTGDTSANLVEGSDITATGSIEVIDSDSGDTPVIANTNVDGQYGSLSLVDGDWTYTLDPSVAQGLNSGQTATDTITLTDSENNEHQIVITIEGTADTAVVSGKFTGSVSTETSPVVEITNLFVFGEDVDGDSSDFNANSQPSGLNFSSTGFSANITDSDGRLNNDGSQSIELNGESYPVSVNATVQYTDAYGNVFTMAVLTVSVTQTGEYFGSKAEPTTMLVQIDGPNITSGTDLTLVDGSYNEVSSINYLDVSDAVTATGQIGISDADTNDTPEFANTTIEGQYGTFELVDGNWTYTLDPSKAEALGSDDIATETFTLTASDNTQQSITIEVTGTDDAAVITGDMTASITDQDTSTSGSINITDPDGGQASIGNTTMEGNYGTFELVDGEWTYTVDPDKAQSLPDGQAANDTFTLTASDGSTHEIVVTVTGTNDAAVVTGDTTAQVTDQDTSTTGTITVTDPDSGDTATIGNTTIEGNYGTFELVDGEWTYTVDPDKAQSLPEGQEANDTFTLTASDGSTHEIVVTVTGTDDAAVVTGDTTGQVTDQDTSTTGTITVTDPDSGETATIDNVTMEGNYGTFELVDGNWTYTVDPDKAQSLPEGQEANDTFTLTASDGSTHEIVVTVTGT